MNLEEALNIVDQIIKPNQLTDTQELVFRGCWSSKTYQKIAAEAGYDHDYIRGVGSQLWHDLGTALQTKVGKNNFRSILRQYQQEKPPPVINDKQENDINYPRPSEILEIPEGAVSLDSSFYIERPPIEEQCYSEILKPGALILLKGSSKLGKSSLKNRIIAKCKKHNYQTVQLNFEQADKSVFEDVQSFLRWFCANIALKLKIKSNLDEYWDEDFGSKISCSLYFESYILPQIKSPLVLALDRVNILFEYPQISQNFFPLLRSWYEEAKDVDIWQKLRMIVVYSTEMYVPLNINQSPFNVGLAIRLPEFNQAQIEDLAKRQRLQSPEELKLVTQLQKLVGGNPYLIRLGMYHLKMTKTNPEKILTEASTMGGIYRHLLHSHWTNLQKYPELMSSMKEVVNNPENVQLGPIVAYKLESMGIVKLEGNFVKPSCELYRTYFHNQLKDNTNNDHESKF